MEDGSHYRDLDIPNEAIMRNIFKFLLFGAIFVLTVWAYAFSLSKLLCMYSANQMGIRWEYTIAYGCMVNHKGIWKPLEHVETID